jgi:hypothetical protein
MRVDAPEKGLKNPAHRKEVIRSWVFASTPSLFGHLLSELEVLSFDVTFVWLKRGPMTEYARRQ